MTAGLREGILSRIADMGTVSETLFAAFCRQKQFVVIRVEPSDTAGEKRPDYLVRSRSRRSRTMVVEIKQLEPNAQERKALRTGDQTGAYDWPMITPGERIRDAIGAAAPQIKALATDGQPALLVIYDNIFTHSLHTDPYAVLTAMRGLDIVPVAVPRDPTLSPTFGAPRPGPRRRMTANANTTISAIALLRRVGPRGTALHVFHNRFARVPLRRRDLLGVNVRHFCILKGQNGWSEI